MGRPRMIILIRHAQSEGNQNRQIHQTIPDHRVKLTSQGWEQARAAGRQLRALLEPSDSLQFYTSPYRRTRETCDGILQTLTGEGKGGDGGGSGSGSGGGRGSDGRGEVGMDGEGQGEGEADGPSPFSRSSIRVFEEPRLREQDFGNFQPNSDAMEKMWKERADYGHFFYRIPNGESAADAYDRVSGFNETLFRSFGEEDFPSVCVLVTHGLMTRVFLMRWYHWSVEYFEDLRNVNHCEMVIMKRSPDSGKFRLQNQLRTWSELKRQRARERGEDPDAQQKVAAPISPVSIPVRRGWNAKRQESLREDKEGNGGSRTGLWQGGPRSQPYSSTMTTHTEQVESAPKGARPQGDPHEDDEEAFPEPAKRSQKSDRPDTNIEPPEEFDLGNEDQKMLNDRLTELQVGDKDRPATLSFLSHPSAGRGFRGSPSGAATPAAAGEYANMDYFNELRKRASAETDSKQDSDGNTSRDRARTPSPEERKRWSAESGMGSGARANKLGDSEDNEGDGEGLSDQESRDKSVRGSVY